MEYKAEDGKSILVLDDTDFKNLNEKYIQEKLDLFLEKKFNSSRFKFDINVKTEQILNSILSKHIKIKIKELLDNGEFKVLLKKDIRDTLDVLIPEMKELYKIALEEFKKEDIENEDNTEKNN